MTLQFTDNRDGHVYKTVKIGGKLWMAENMRYAGVEHYSANNDSSNDNKYGYLYKWNEALKVSPAGWHLPTKADFESLLKASGSNNNKKLLNPAFLALIAKDSAWKLGYKDKVIYSTNFGALPAGYYNGDNFNYFGYLACFWSATEGEGITYLAHCLRLGNGDADVYFKDKDYYAFSVRCIKD